MCIKNTGSQRTHPHYEQCVDAFLWREPRRTTHGRVNNGASFASCPASHSPSSIAAVICKNREQAMARGKRKKERGGEAEASTARSGLAATLLITFYYNVLVGVIFMVFAMLNDFFMCPAIFSLFLPLFSSFFSRCCLC